jgi:hypothetical protein
LTVTDHEHYVFKGNRDYLHGTSMLDIFLTHAGTSETSIAEFDLVIFHSTRNHCEVTDQRQAGHKLIARFTHEQQKLYLYELDEPITRSIEYDDPAPGEDFELGTEKSVMIGSTGGHKRIELLVGSYRHLLDQLFGNKKFRFARLQAAYLPSPPFTISFHRILSSKFYEGQIRDAHQLVGNLYFSFSDE